MKAEAWDKRDPKNRFGLPANLFKTCSSIPGLTFSLLSLSTTTQKCEEETHHCIA